jgi:gamma-glutamylcyclotransferase (GGCT)/AIG2-like uncharacterized protein YtfP
MKQNKHFYFGYGMNTNIGGMRKRCPAAISMGSSVLYDHDFRFAYHADVVPCGGHKVAGVLWEITDQCLASLDRLESCHVNPDGSFAATSYYARKIVPILYCGAYYDAWVYYMMPGNIEHPPGQSYWDCLMTGYKKHNVSRRQLHLALQSSYKNYVEPATSSTVDVDDWYDRYRSGIAEVWHNNSLIS